LHRATSADTVASFGSSHGHARRGTPGRLGVKVVGIKFSTSGIKWNLNERIDMHCPNGHSMRPTLGEIKRNATVRCSAGESVKLDAEDFNRTLAKLDRQIKDMFR
jgi:hypothetical protein